MKTVRSWFKQLRLKNFLAVLLGSLLLFVTTACSGANATTPGAGSSAKESMIQGNTADDAIRGGGEKLMRGKTSDQIRPDMPSGRANSPYEGGMNKYPDTDPRRDTSSAGSAAENLVRNAQGEVIDQTGNVGENIKRTLDKKAENWSGNTRNPNEGLESLPSKAKSNTEDFAEGTKRGYENLKGNVKDTAETAASKAKETSKSVQRAAEDTADVARSKAGEASKTTQRALEDTANALD